MALEKARELLSVQADTGGGYNRNAAGLILAEVRRGHGQDAVEESFANSTRKPRSDSAPVRNSGPL